MVKEANKQTNGRTSRRADGRPDDGLTAGLTECVSSENNALYYCEKRRRWPLLGVDGFVLLFSLPRSYHATGECLAKSVCVCVLVLVGHLKRPAVSVSLARSLHRFDQRNSTCSYATTTITRIALSEPAPLLQLPALLSCALSGAVATIATTTTAAANKRTSGRMETIAIA